MKKIVDTQSIFYNHFESLKKYPKWLFAPVIFLLKKLFHEQEVNEFLAKHAHLEGFEFVEAVVEHFNVSYKSSSKEKLNIPSSGKVIIVANHPLGALDALCLIMLVKEVRQDIKIVANELLSYFPGISPLIIPVDAMNGKSKKESIKDLYKALDDENVLIIFPSGEVSRARPTGVKDTKWNKGFLTFAKKANAPILPIYIKARNSSFFYTASMLSKSFATLLLPNEMFKKKNGVLEYKIGEIIPYKFIAEMSILTDKQAVLLIQKHLYKIARKKQGIIKTQSPIAHPENRQALKSELQSAELLGYASDKKLIYLAQYKKDSPLMREIGRLREFTFRQVEEGTGGKRDIDRYDEYYKHIVLWDDDDLEIVGSYRIGESDYIMEKYGKSGFYSNTLFEYEEGMDEYLKNSVELGRSFVQPRYWGSRALDYLWQGVGAYLHKNRHINYLFGPVTLSNSYPKINKNMIIHFYAHYFAPPKKLVSEKEPFVISRYERKEVESLYSGKSYKDDFRVLKNKLPLGTSVPTLYKQYAELCDEGGIFFAGFNVDHEFGDCVDSFIVVKVGKIKKTKKSRYIKGL